MKNISAQRIHDAVITTFLRQNNITTSRDVSEVFPKCVMVILKINKTHTGNTFSIQEVIFGVWCDVVMACGIIVDLENVCGQNRRMVGIGPSHISYNALDKYPMMHHFVTEMCTHVHISVTEWCIVGHVTGALCDLWNRSINSLRVL